MTAVTRTITTHPLMSYFALTFVFSWTLWLLAQPFYMRGHVMAAPFLILGIFGPALISVLLSRILRPGRSRGSRDAAIRASAGLWMAALLLFAADQVMNEKRFPSVALFVACAGAAILPSSVLLATLYSGPGIRAHLRTLLKPKGKPVYYVLAILLFPAIWGAGIILTRSSGLPIPGPKTSASGAALAMAIFVDSFYGLFYTGLSEEPGWRGFALQRLQARFSPLVSSLILGILWAVWHAPARFGGFEARSAADTAVEWTFLVVITPLFTCLYNRTNFSLLSTVLLHVAANVTSRFLPLTIGGIALLFGCVVFVVVKDRMWRCIAAASLAVSTIADGEENHVPTTGDAYARMGKSLVGLPNRAAERERSAR